MNKGIVLIARGANIYLQMACTLARAIKLTGSNLPVSIIADRTLAERFNTYNKSQYGLDCVLSADIADTWDNCDLKLNINDFSPYEHTIFIDCDSMLFRNADLSALMDSLVDGESSVQFQASRKFTLNVLDNSFAGDWVSGAELRKSPHVCGTIQGKELFNVGSSFFYFRKCAETTAFFEECKLLKAEIIKNKIAFMGWQGSSIPDELIFTLATYLLPKMNGDFLILGYSSDFASMNFNVAKMEGSRYYGFTLNGQQGEKNLKDLYNKFSAMNAQKRGILPKQYNIYKDKLYGK